MGTELPTRLDYLCAMGMDEIARAGRRRQALDALEFERERETALREQLELIITELEGGRIDEAAFSKMAPGDVEIVRETLDPQPAVDPEEENWLDFGDDDGAATREDGEAEIARLESEIAESRRRQRAFESYIEALEQNEDIAR